MKPEDRKAMEEVAFENAAHKYLMDNQDSTIKESVTELLGDWALDAVNAGWDAACAHKDRQYKQVIEAAIECIEYFQNLADDKHIPFRFWDEDDEQTLATLKELINE